MHGERETQAEKEAKRLVRAGVAGFVVHSDDVKPHLHAIGANGNLGPPIGCRSKRAKIASMLLAFGLLVGCAPAPKMQVLDYCDVPSNVCGALAELPPEIQAQLVEQSWCCNGSDPCEPVTTITDCAITDIAIICEHGSSHPSSGPIGSGFECYG